MTTTSTSQNICKPTRETAVFTPRFDLWEGDDELILFGDLPGVAPGDLEIQYEEGTLTISGKVSAASPQRKLLCGEYGVGDYLRSFTIGESVEPEGIHAELRDGVLTIHLPKAEAVKPRRINVKTA